MPERLRSLSGPRRALSALLAALVVLMVVFIWSNSLKGPEASLRQSAVAERLVKPLILAIPMPSLHTPEMISLLTRKLGHFAEFFLLGVLLVALAVFPSTVALADTTPPTSPPASATATPSPAATTTAEPDGEETDLPDVPLDDTRTVLALTGAGILALVAAAVVFLRR